MDHFQSIPDFVLDLIFGKLDHEDLYEACQVSKTWFNASLRRIRRLVISREDNLLKSAVCYYNKHRGDDSELNWCAILKDLSLDELVVESSECLDYLLEHGCNAVNLIFRCKRSLSLETLKKCPRLETFELHIAFDGVDPFVAECFRSWCDDSDVEKRLEDITRIKLKYNEHLNESTVLQSVIGLSVKNDDIDFIKRLLKDCARINEFELLYGEVTKGWYHIFPANVKRITFTEFMPDEDLADEINFYNDFGRQLLPYVAQHWQSMQRFYCSELPHDNKFLYSYEVLPPTREESIDCSIQDGIEDTIFSSEVFTCRSFTIQAIDYTQLHHKIPPAKTISIKYYESEEKKFSPYYVCLNPTQWEHLTIDFDGDEEFDGFEPGSFQGLNQLQSISISANAESLAMILNDCSSLTKLDLVDISEGAIAGIPNELRFHNIKDLCLKRGSDSITEVIRVFPNLERLEFKNGVAQPFKDLCQQLLNNEKPYGAVFYLKVNHFIYLSNTVLSVVLKEAQVLLKRHKDCRCYLKGFKMISRHVDQEILFSVDIL